MSYVTIIIVTSDTKRIEEMVMILLLVLDFFLLVKAGEQYFISAPNGVSCPTQNVNCYRLSHFTEHSSLYFSDNTVFYFLEGRHVLNDTIEINGVSNLTLKGLGTMEQGFHYTVLQSTVEISCEGAVSAGLVFINVSDVSISGLLITRCSGKVLREISPEFSKHLAATGSVVSEVQNQSASILIFQSSCFQMSKVSIVNTTGFALIALNLFNSTIAKSSFASNNREYPCSFQNTSDFSSYCYSGNSLIAFTHPWPDVPKPPLDHTFVKIEHTNFSFGYSQPDHLDHMLKGGLIISLNQGVSYCTDIVLIGVTAFKNSPGNIKFLSTIHTICFAFSCNSIGSFFGNVDRERSGLYHTSGGGLQIFLGLESNLLVKGINLKLVHASPRISINSSEFSHNYAEVGGGVSIWVAQTSVYILLQSCMFSFNKGLKGIGLHIINLNARRIKAYYTILNSTVTHSLYDGGDEIEKEFGSSISFFYMKNVKVRNFHVLSNDPCYGMYIYYSVVSFYGKDNTFFNNTSPRNGGAMYLTLSSSIELTHNSFITFHENHALGEGGALFVESNRDLSAFCFLDVPDYSGSQGMKFMNNTAGEQGDAIYIDDCSRLQQDEMLIGERLFNVIQLDQSKNRLELVSVPYQIFHCTNSSSSKFKYIAGAFPGENITFPIITKGVFGVTSNGFVQVEIKDDPESDILIFSPVSLGTYSELHCKFVWYVIQGRDEGAFNITVYVSTLQKHFTKDGTEVTDTIEFSVNVLECPIGFMLFKGECQCDEKLSEIISNITCNITHKTITRVGKVWIGLDSNKNSMLVTTDCPYDYCVHGSVSFNESTPDNQCRMNRSGIMCGQCSEGLSLMLGSNQCGVCTNSSLYLLVVFGVAGIVLVLFLVVLNLTVSVGTINGLIFYTNVIKINEHAFLSNSSPPVLSQFISWFNLDIGISTCFTKSLDAPTKLFLQFIFPTYIWILIGVVIIVCKYSQRLSELIGHNVFPVFATLILLSYTKSLRVLVPILKFHRLILISDDNKLSHQMYWSADGNISSSSPYYGLLAFLGVLIVILFAIPYTLLLLFQPLIHSKLTNSCVQQFCLKLKPLIDAYYGPYKAMFQGWTGVLLCVRLLLVLTASFASHEIYLSISVSLGVCLMVIMGYFGGVYNQKIPNALEYWSLFNIIVLSTLVKVFPHVAAVGLSAMFCTFLAVILYHFCTSKSTTFCCQHATFLKGPKFLSLLPFQKKTISPKRERNQSLLSTQEDISTRHVRESLLFSYKSTDPYSSMAVN